MKKSITYRYKIDNSKERERLKPGKTSESHHQNSRKQSKVWLTVNARMFSQSEGRAHTDGEASPVLTTFHPLQLSKFLETLSF